MKQLAAAMACSGAEQSSKYKVGGRVIGTQVVSVLGTVVPSLGK